MKKQLFMLIIISFSICSCKWNEAESNTTDQTNKDSLAIDEKKMKTVVWLLLDMFGLK